jgi:hypothetical protein
VVPPSHEGQVRGKFRGSCPNFKFDARNLVQTPNNLIAEIFVGTAFVFPRPLARVVEELGWSSGVEKEAQHGEGRTGRESC